MRACHMRARTIGEQHRQAVGNHNRAHGAPVARDAGVGVRTIIDHIGIDHARAVHLPQPARRLRQMVLQQRAVRGYGFATLAEVKLGVLEADGSLSVVPVDRPTKG